MLRPIRFVPALLVVALAGACSVPSNAPEAYDATVEANFLAGCTGDVPETDGTTTTLAAANFCECAYAVFVDNVPYDEDDRNNREDADGRRYFADYPEGAPTFTDLNNEAGSDPEAAADELPGFVRSELEGCAAGTIAGPVVRDGGSSSDNDDG